MRAEDSCFGSLERDASGNFLDSQAYYNCYSVTDMARIEAIRLGMKSSCTKY